MAVYKVAQDVEADDKLIGPFSFRQFVYLIIVVISGAAMWGLFGIFPVLAIIPLPFIVLFGALALPLRKDQPMETYLAAIISFYVKPRRRLWESDGIESTIVVTAPKNEEIKLTKDLTTTEAEKRLEYLAALADTRGWSIRHTTKPTSGTAMVDDVYNDAQSTQDMLDDSSGVVQNFTTIIDQADARRHDDMVARLKAPVQTLPLATQQTQTQPVSPQPVTQSQQAAATDPAMIHLDYNPYPSSIHQSVISPIDPNQPTPQVQSASTPQVASEPQPTTSVIPSSPAIMDLANNKDLSIEAIAHEANRRAQKLEDDEVVISLR